jgi:hypothetical protein
MPRAFWVVLVVSILAVLMFGRLSRATALSVAFFAPLGVTLFGWITALCVRTDYALTSSAIAGAVVVFVASCLISVVLAIIITSGKRASGAKDDADI